MREHEQLVLHKHDTPSLGKRSWPFKRIGNGRIWALPFLDAQPLVLAFAICAGAIFYFSLDVEPTFSAVLVSFISLLLIYLAVRRMPVPQVLAFCALVALGLGIGVLSSKLRVIRVAAPSITTPVGPVMIEGWVQSVEPGAKGNRLRLRVHAIAGVDADDTPKYARVTHRMSLNVSPGRFVRCWSVLRPPPAPGLQGDYDFQRQAWFEQLGSVGYVQGRCRGGTLGAPAGLRGRLALKVASLRRKLAVYVNDRAGTSGGGFAAAIVSGDRSFMSTEDQDALRGSGLAHLLAISGLHMGIVGGMIFLILKRAFSMIEPLALRIAVQKPAAFGALFASLVYLILSGASVSTQRAFIMSAVVFGAVLFDRAAISMRSFAIAMIAVLILQPESCMTPGFQMSFAASGALIATYEAWTARRIASAKQMGTVSYTFASLIVTSTVAAVATAPFAIYHFDRVAALGLLANFLAMPVITFVAAPASAFALIAAPIGGADMGLGVLGQSLSVVLEIARWCSRAGEGGLTFGKVMPSISLLLLSSALILAVVSRGYWRAFMAAPLVAGAVWVWSSAPATLLHWSKSGDLFVAGAEGKMTRYELEDGDGLSPLRYSKIKASSECTQDGCEITTPIGVISVRKNTHSNIPCDSPGVIAFITMSADDAVSKRNPDCIPVYEWREVRDGNSLTVKYRSDQQLNRVAVSCSKRPWRQCK